MAPSQIGKANSSGDEFMPSPQTPKQREKINKEAGTQRIWSHAIFTPGWQRWLDKFDDENERLKPEPWKGYTIGRLTTSARWIGAE